MVIYSFQGERLAEHSYLVLRIYVTAFGDRHERVVANRLEVDEGQVSLVMRFSCLLHDVGKAMRGYRRGGSYAFHEIPSACLAYGTLRSLVGPGLALGASLAVLQHHQAMRAVVKVLEEGWRRVPLGEGIDEAVVEEVELAAKMAEHLLPREAAKAIMEFKRVVREFSCYERAVEAVSKYINFVSSVYKGMMGALKATERERLRRILLVQPLLTAPLQLSDYLAALLARGGKLRVLHNEIIKHLFQS